MTALLSAPVSSETGRSLVAMSGGGRLVLRHPVFRSFLEPYFRLSDSDHAVVFVIQLDQQEAILPLAAMMTEFGIMPDDEDGRMLELVGRGLQFVTGLQLGDPLPTEVLTGKASWTVEEFHRDQAVARLSQHVLRCAGGKDGMSDPAVLHQVHLLADDLAYIEALREWLLKGARRMDRVLTRLARGFSGDTTHKEILAQIRRLTGKGIVEIEACFMIVDQAIADVETAFADPAALQALLHRQRDTLYRRWRAWEPYCREWAMIGARDGARTWNLVHDTYRFLAPRYMTVVEWRARFPQQDVEPPASMTW